MNKRLYSKKKSDAVSGYLFLLPALLAFLLFIGAPMVITIVLSFFDYNMLQGSEWINFDNYIEFFKNPTSWQIIWNTFKLTLILVALHIVIALLLAFVIYKEKRGPVKYVYRTAVYLPSILTTASVAIAWYYMFNYDFGVFNWLLSQLGISGVKCSHPPLGSLWPFACSVFGSSWALPFCTILLAYREYRMDTMKRPKLTELTKFRHSSILLFPCLRLLCFS